MIDLKEVTEKKNAAGRELRRAKRDGESPQVIGALAGEFLSL